MKNKAIEAHGEDNTDKSYEYRLKELKALHHSQCIFEKNPPVQNLKFRFRKDGMLNGRFVCTEKHQGYDGMVHGGLIAAIIDASMTQCLMGHGIAAYTVNLSIDYLNPILIDQVTFLETRIAAAQRGMIYNLVCEIRQQRKINVRAHAQFFKGRKLDNSNPI